MNFNDFAIVTNLLIGLFNVCMAFSNYLKENYELMIFNLGGAICIFLMAILIAVVNINSSNKRKYYWEYKENE